jgi:hypothetical protein
MAFCESIVDSWMEMAIGPKFWIMWMVIPLFTMLSAMRILFLS